MITRISTLNQLKNLYKPNFLYPKVNTQTVRFAAIDKSVQQNDKENWSEIYRLPLIRLASAFNRLKIYQSLVTVVGTPGVYALEQAGHLDPNYGSAFAILGITGMLTLAICSYPIQKLIGFVYINENDDKVKIGYVDFWGNRKDHILNIDDILGPWEIPEQRINLYQRIINREDERQSFKLLHRYGVVRDPERYVRVFGDGNI